MVATVTAVLAHMRVFIFYFADSVKPLFTKRVDVIDRMEMLIEDKFDFVEFSTPVVSFVTSLLWWLRNFGSYVSKRPNVLLQFRVCFKRVRLKFLHRINPGKIDISMTSFSIFHLTLSARGRNPDLCWVFFTIEPITNQTSFKSQHFLHVSPQIFLIFQLPF